MGCLGGLYVEVEVALMSVHANIMVIRGMEMGLKVVEILNQYNMSQGEALVSASLCHLC